MNLKRSYSDQRYECYTFVLIYLNGQKNELETLVFRPEIRSFHVRLYLAQPELRVLYLVYMYVCVSE